MEAARRCVVGLTCNHPLGLTTHTRGRCMSLNRSAMIAAIARATDLTIHVSDAARPTA